ncbi:fatty acid desaturase [Micromonospora sp. NPDC000089]|uniref:fatty acid desaturase n=1 Tax=unclassified Micromonospora TaxID=2617518 RepID=UPI00367C9A8D
MPTRLSAESRGDTATSAVLITAALVVVALQLVVLPLVLLPADPRWGWLLVPLAATTTPYWSLVHEAIHGSLLPTRRHNDRWGRVLAIGYGAPFALLKTGHLLHHRYSRTRRERSEVYDPAEVGRAGRVGMVAGHYLRLFGGLYLAEVASLLLLAAPQRLWRWLADRLDAPDTVTGLLLDAVRRRQLRAFRVDAAVVVGAYAAAAIGYGRHVWMLAAALGARATLVSLADNAYHYGTRLDAPLEAMNLRLPRPLEAFVLAFNLHAVHHRHPGLPWHRLRAALLADGDELHLGWFRAVGRQLRGPIPLDDPRLAPLGDAPTGPPPLGVGAGGER